MVTPFEVTPAWLREYLRRVREGIEETGAKLAANEALGIKGKAFARCTIAGPSILTVPVAGGSGMLKRKDSDPMLSDHGKWRREHLGAFNAIYGRTPYYEHLMPEIREVYDNSAGISLQEFNDRLLKVAMRWIDLPALERVMYGDDSWNMDYLACISRIRLEAKAKTDPGLSIFDAIFRLGRESVWIV